MLQSAFVDNSFGENITETTSAIPAGHNAVFAINGGYYGFRDTGIVIRNGVVYRDEGARQGLAFYRDGTVQVYDETSTTAGQLVAAGVTMTGLAEIMQDLGAITAYNLDGGGSSTMYFNGELVNDPLGQNKERGTSDIL